MIHLFDRIEIFDTVAPAPKPRAIRTPNEVTRSRAFDEQQHRREMAAIQGIGLPLNLRPRRQRGPVGLLRRWKVVAA